MSSIRRFFSRERIGRRRLVAGLILAAVAAPVFVSMVSDVTWWLRSDGVETVGILLAVGSNASALVVGALWVLSPLWARRPKDDDN